MFQIRIIKYVNDSIVFTGQSTKALSQIHTNYACSDYGIASKRVMHVWLYSCVYNNRTNAHIISRHPPWLIAVSMKATDRRSIQSKFNQICV